MAHYEHQQEQDNQLMLVTLTEKNILSKKMAQIDNLKVSINFNIEKIKSSEKINKFVDKVSKTGGMGIVGLLPKIPEIIPELTPIIPIIKNMNEINKVMFEVLNGLVNRVEELERINNV